MWKLSYLCRGTIRNTMNILREAFRFASNGAATWRKAASGRYDYESDDIRRIREELARGSSRADDKLNMLKDRSRMYADCRSAFNKIKRRNG